MSTQAQYSHLMQEFVNVNDRISQLLLGLQRIERRLPQAFAAADAPPGAAAAAAPLQAAPPQLAVEFPNPAEVHEVHGSLIEIFYDFHAGCSGARCPWFFCHQ